jgi:histidyl-tRNA synthetase
MSVRQHVFNRLFATIETFGYQRYDGPLLEPVEIYEAKSGREIVDQQIYTLTDRGNRRLALRPEMTPSVARMIAGHANALQFPARWYCHVNCHRYERPQRGRVREHWQVNVDIFGSESPRCELEIFEVIHAIMASVGASRDMYVVRVNDRMLLDAMLTSIAEVPPSLRRDAAALVDRWEKQPADELHEDALKLGLTESQFTRLTEALGAGEKLLGMLPAEQLERSPLVKLLKEVPADFVQYDPLIVRGFDYYTSTVFEVFDRDPRNNRSLFGGGRYANLAEIFTTKKIPGIGFGMGDVTLFNFLDAHGLLPDPQPAFEVSVVPVAEEMWSAVGEVTARLRAAGLRAVAPLEPRRLGKEIERAVRAGASVAVIVGSDEWATGRVILRDLRNGTQSEVSVEELADRTAALLGSTGPGDTVG